MFIPRGKVIHENLATSYVLVEVLVSDLCDGGFSGVVEVVLRDTDSYVVIDSGSVEGAVEMRGDSSIRTTVAQLADRARLDRGRVSVYAYTAATAKAVAGRMNAQPLYAGLSTEFADLRKMIGKLAREQDREWFVDLSTNSGFSALMHIRDSRCRIMSSVEEASEEESDLDDLASDAALGKLLYECDRNGGTFDVYVKVAEEATNVDLDASEPGSGSIYGRTPVSEERVEAQTSWQPAGSGTLTPAELLISSLPNDGSMVAATPEFGFEERIGDSNKPSASAAANPAGSETAFDVASFTAIDDSESPGVALDFPTDDRELSFGREELGTEGEAEVMAEIKRLMGEIARTIEVAAQSVDRHDSFSISLRAGQLKIAERYPFLDPFGGEFEYLGGEIVFVGRAGAEEFIVGFTEALKLAVDAVTRSSAYADRFRAYVIEDLQKLLERSRHEFERFGLDEVIEEIIRL
jgi:hypothetical protein